MDNKKKAAPGEGNGNEIRGLFKNNQKIVIIQKPFGNYAVLLEVYYFNAGKQHKATIFTKDLSVLDNEKDFKNLIWGAVDYLRKQGRAIL